MNKSIVNPNNYTFDAGASTITFKQAYGTVPIENILVITNLESNTIIYNFACAGYGGTVSGFVLTLETSTAGMSSDDLLQVIVYQEPAVANKTDLALTQLQVTSLETLQCILDEQKITNALLKEILND